jgi:hypothetical protein
MNVTPMTASIADSFDPMVTIDNNDTVLLIDTDKNLILQSTKIIPAGVWKSLRISFLYNDKLKDIISTSLQSDYSFSLSYNDDLFTVLIDLQKHTLESWKHIVSLPLHQIDIKDIPILDSVMLFDGDRIDTLSTKTSSSRTSSDIH